MDEQQKPAVNIRDDKIQVPQITRRDLEKELEDRMGRIDNEFRESLTFIQKYPKSVTIFGSARFPETDPYYQKAVSIAKKISCEGYAVITGGGPGIMEAGNRGAKEASCEGPSLAMNIELPEEQILNPYIDDNVSFHYFFSRKVALTFSAEVYIYFPGGFGTMDELFEILTLLKTKKIENVPIILVGNDFWGKFDRFIKDVLLEYGTIDAHYENFYTITEDEDEIMDIVRKAALREE